MSLDDCAFSIITTVVSRPTADRAILDGGSKTFSSDLLTLSGHGLILEHPDARIYNLSEEHGFVDLSQEALKLSRAVSVVAFSKDGSGGHIQSGEERCGPVSFVLVSVAFWVARPERQEGLCPIESLNLALFVHAEHHCAIGGIEVQPDNVANLVDQLGIFRESEALSAVRLKAEGAPNATDRCI